MYYSTTNTFPMGECTVISCQMVKLVGFGVLYSCGFGGMCELSLFLSEGGISLNGKASDSSFSILFALT